jgi:sialidase-1
MTDFPSPLAPEFITRIPTTGDLLILWCNNPHAPGLRQGEAQPTVSVARYRLKLGEVRMTLTSAISRDEGETWECARDITDDPEGEYGDYGYPAVTFIEGGTVALVSYNALDGVHLARIGVDWFYGD